MIYKAYIIWAIICGCFETITVPRWFKSSMAHKAAIHHLLFWLFAGYLFWKSHSAKCFFGAMRKSFEMILKSFFSVWLWREDYKLTSVKVTFDVLSVEPWYNHRSWKLQILCQGQNQFWPIESSFIAKISNQGTVVPAAEVLRINLNVEVRGPSSSQIEIDRSISLPKMLHIKMHIS